MRPRPLSTLLRRQRDAFGVLAVILASRVMALAAMVGLAHALTQASFGRIVLAVTALGLVALVADFGTGDWLTREAPRSQERRGAVLGARLTMSVVAAGIVCAGILVVGRSNWVLVVAVAGSLPAIALITNQVCVDRLNGLPLRAAVRNAVPPLLPYLVAWAFVSFVSEMLLPLAFMLGLWCVALSSLIRGRAPKPMSPHRAFRLAWKARQFALTSVSVAIYSRVDRLLLGAFAGAAAAATYSAAYTLVFGLSMLGPALAWVSLPLLSTAPDLAHWKAEFVGRLRLALLAGVVVAIAFLVAGRPTLRMLFGANYRISMTTTLAFSALSALYILNPVLATALVSRGSEGFVARLAGMMCIVASVLYPILAKLDGLVGVAVASASIEIGNCIALTLRLLVGPQSDILQNPSSIRLGIDN
jgi:O-antigen/teichoic acid export membrane protein